MRGLFDDVRCKYPLEWPEVQGDIWQSKCTPDQYMSFYEIREDGTLWKRSTETICPMHHGLPEDGLPKTIERWTRVRVDGEIAINHLAKSDAGQDWWYEVRFWFRDGIVKDMVSHKRKSGLNCVAPAPGEEAGR